MAEMDKYPWSGHRAVIEKAKYPWMDTATVLAQFGGTKKNARNEYRRFMQEGMDQGHDPHFSGGGLLRSLGGWEQILGSGDFVHQVIKEAEGKSLRQMKLNIVTKGCSPRYITLINFCD